MDELENLKEFKDDTFRGIVGYAASILLFLSQFVFWILKKIKELRNFKKETRIYKVQSPYFQYFGEIVRLDIFLKKICRLRPPMYFSKILFLSTSPQKKKIWNPLKSSSLITELFPTRRVSRWNGFLITFRNTTGFGWW